MSFLNIFKKSKKENKEIKFTTQIFKTENILNTLMNIANKYNLNLSALDFDILNVETYIRFNKDDEFVLMDEETENLITEEVLLNEDFDIKQVYEIKIKRFQFLDNFELIGKFQKDRFLTNSIYVISPQSLLHYSFNLESEILKELYKKKLKSRMLIKFKPFEKELINDIKNIAESMKKNEKIEESFIILCKAIKPVFPVEMEVIEHYKNLSKRDDLLKQLIYPIKKGEIIIEIIKPKEGKNGRNCRGEYIKVPSLKNKNIPQFEYNSSDIIRKEDKDSIKYIANKDGYIYIKNNFIYIKDELEINQISLQTGNVKGAQDSNIRIEVNEHDVMKEAIRDGMLVETTELFVKGNVGNNAKIKAKNLIIEGQTHRNSKIAAIKAEINIHKGLLKGKEVLVHRLEGGKIEAEKVHIIQAISGEIRAKKITIDILGSHIKLISSELIEIKNLKGSENKFIINENSILEEHIRKKEDAIKELRIKFRQIKDRFYENKQIILRNKYLIDELKNKIDSNKKNNLPIKSVWIQKVRKFNSFIKDTKNLEKSLQEIKVKINSIKEELNKMQNSLFLAKIISHSGFPEYNRIEFNMIKPSKKIVYDTNEYDKNIKIFRLQDYGEEGYKIIGSKGDNI
jgi:hypothetical protein